MNENKPQPLIFQEIICYHYRIIFLLGIVVNQVFNRFFSPHIRQTDKEKGDDKYVNSTTE